MNTADAIFFEEDKFYFWDELGTGKVGPYTTHQEAVVALSLYITSIQYGE